jgi:circadian clock protein KaiC
MRDNHGETEVSPYERLPSGVPGFDTVLKGGFLKGGVYLLLGPPGAGKTILANQISFSHAQNQGGSVVYVTLLAESHSRMMGNLRGLEFFRDSLVAQSVHYLSGYRALEQEGLKGLLALVAGVVREKKATLLLVDGVSTVGELDQTPIAFRKFVHELNSFIGVSGCTAFLLSSLEGHLSHPEHTMVDGIFSLHHRQAGLRAVRQIEVRKFRGSDHLYGRHSIKIDGDGMRVFPRLEAMGAPACDLSLSGERMPFGIAGFDEMMHGGVLRGSVTCLVGSAGTGKTLLGLQFLAAGAAQGERGVFFGLYETPAELLQKADHVGLAFRGAVERGQVQILWRAALEHELDELGELILNAVRAHGARRLFIDGIDGLRYSAAFPNRLDRFLTALILHLKALRVTVVFAEESSLFQTHVARHVGELSALNDNLVYLRYTDIDAHLTRVLSIVKIRSSPYDPSVRELVITDAGGLHVRASVRTPDTLLSNQSRPAPAPRRPQKKKA